MGSRPSDGTLHWGRPSGFGCTDQQFLESRRFGPTGEWPPSHPRDCQDRADRIGGGIDCRRTSTSRWIASGPIGSRRSSGWLPTKSGRLRPAGEWPPSRPRDCQGRAHRPSEPFGCGWAPASGRVATRSDSAMRGARWLTPSGWVQRPRWWIRHRPWDGRLG